MAVSKKCSRARRNLRRAVGLSALVLATGNVAQAAQYYYGGFDGTNTGTPANPVSASFSTAGNNFWQDSAGVTQWGAGVTPPNSNTTEIILGGVSGATNYTTSDNLGSTAANDIILQANNSGTNTLDFNLGATTSNRLSLATPSPAQTFGASIQQQGSANWTFTNTGNSTAPLRFANSFQIAGAGSGNISIPFVMSNTSSAVNATVSLTGGATLQLGGVNLFGGTTGQFFNLANGTVDFTNGRAFGNASNQIRLTSGTLLSSNGSTVATYSGSSAGTAGGILIAGNVTFGGTTSWSLGASITNLTGNRTITANNTGTTGTTIPGILGDNGNAFSLTVTSTGNGLLTLSNANTYTGGTFLTAGTLILANTTGSATGTGSATLNGGLFASAPDGGANPFGVGTVGSATGAVIAGSGAHTIAPGGDGTFGHFNLSTAGLTTNNLTTLKFDLTAPETASDDEILAGGASSFGTGTQLAFPTAPTTDGDYRLISYTGSDPTLGNFVLPAAPSGKTYSLSTTADTGYVDLVVADSVPEPASFALALLGGTLISARRRRNAP